MTVSRLSGAVLFLASMGCASTHTPDPGAAVAPSSEPHSVHAPAEVAAYAIADSIRYSRPEFGTVYRYRGEGPLRPDVYVYPKQPNSTIETQAASFRRVLETNRRRGRYTDFRITTDRAWSPVEWAQGREMMIVLRFDQQSSDSYYHVFQVGDQFVKVRITNPQDEITVHQVHAFVEALLRTMARQAGPTRTNSG